MRGVITMLVVVTALTASGCKGNGACMAHFSGALKNDAACQLTAVYAGSTMSTAIAFSGMLPGSAYRWEGLSASPPGRPAQGGYDLPRLLDASGDVTDGNSDAWAIAGGSDVGQSMGTLSLSIAATTVTASVSSGDIYDLHGSASARLPYMGSRGGVADLLVTIDY